MVVEMVVVTVPTRQQVPVSDADRCAMRRRQAIALGTVDDGPEIPVERRAGIHAWADDARAAAGLPPLRTETEFYRHADARGLRRRRPPTAR
jgi:hypothetical protein